MATHVAFYRQCECGVNEYNNGFSVNQFHNGSCVVGSVSDVLPSRPAATTTSTCPATRRRDTPQPR